MENYRKVFQFMMARGCVKASEFTDFLSSLRGDTASQLTDERVVEAVSNLNKKLSKYNMMIRASIDDVTIEKYYALISTVDNAITRQASHHTPKEFDYFRLVWQAIIQGDTTLDTLQQIASQNKVANYEELLQEWQHKHWLVLDGDKFRLGVRAKAELDVLQLSQLDSHDTSGQ